MLNRTQKRYIKYLKDNFLIDTADELSQKDINNLLRLDYNSKSEIRTYKDVESFLNDY